MAVTLDSYLLSSECWKFYIAKHKQVYLEMQILIATAKVQLFLFQTSIKPEILIAVSYAYEYTVY